MVLILYSIFCKGLFCELYEFEWFLSKTTLKLVYATEQQNSIYKKFLLNLKPCRVTLQCLSNFNDVALPALQLHISRMFEKSWKSLAMHLLWWSGLVQSETNTKWKLANQLGQNKYKTKISKSVGSDNQLIWQSLFTMSIMWFWLKREKQLRPIYWTMSFFMKKKFE